MISLASVTTPSPLRAIKNPGGYEYLLSLPDDHDTGSTHRWPLVLFLHGSAFCGTNVWQVAAHGLPRLLSGAEDLSAAEKSVAAALAENFVVVAPQCAPYEVWNDAALLTLLDHVGREHKVDTGRVFLTGLSLGGFGAWSLGLRHPDRFAALVPICGGGRIADIDAATGGRRTALQNLGVWAFHCARDVVVPADESARLIDALKNAGVRDARLTIYPSAEHDAWSATYANPELYAWLLRHGK